MKARYIKAMNKQKLYELIKIVATAVISIASVLLIDACTVSMSISKNNRNSDVKTEQTSTSSVDSTRINFEKY